MVAEIEASAYLDEIRREVCARCVEKPFGGPPCAPLGKVCSVELYLDDLLNSIHRIHSNRIDPYLDRNREKVCEKCAFLHSSCCPCPMGSLAVLLVEAVEAVDERRDAEAEQ